MTPILKQKKFKHNKWIAFISAIFCFSYYIGARENINTFLQHQQHYAMEEEERMGSPTSMEKYEGKNQTEKPVKVLPQVLTYGNFSRQSSQPFLGQDVWAEIVDNRQSFFVRPYEPNYPENKTVWKEWFDGLPMPVTLVMNNQDDEPWPEQKNTFDENMLSHRNLKALYVGNPNILHPKVKPLPIGLKWQKKERELYGEEKVKIKEVYKSVASSGTASKSLFQMRSRSETVWLRPMFNTNRRTTNYAKNNPALATVRGEICGLVNQTAPNSTVCCTAGRIRPKVYFSELKRHRFVLSPAGNGLDTHGTWDALLAGCVPVVPHSTLDSMFEGLPVWLVNSWEEVTDAAVKRKASEMFGRADDYNWDKIYTEWWMREITGISLTVS